MFYTGLNNVLTETTSPLQKIDKHFNWRMPHELEYYAASENEYA